MIEPSPPPPASAKERERRELLLGRQPPEEPLRLRPGERPQWVDPGLTAEQVQWLRGRAEKLNLGVDALVSLAVEWELLSSDLDSTYLATREPTSESHATLAPTPALRRWVAQLGAPQQVPAHDSLPQLMLPERLLARWRPTSSAVIYVVAEMPEQAVRDERQASVAGLTLSEWGYRRAWRFATSESSS